MIILANLCIAKDEINSKAIYAKAVRGCKQWGFFAEFLGVLNHLDWCLKTNQVPVVYWGAQSAYYSPNGYHGRTNAWEYYFEPVSNLKYEDGDKIYSNERWYYSDFSTIWHYVQYVDNLYRLSIESGITLIHLPGHDYTDPFFDIERDGRDGFPIKEYQRHLYDKEFRKYVKNRLIDPFIKLQPWVQEKINSFWTSKMKGKKVVGIHLRGKFLGRETIPVPASDILNEAKKYVQQGYLCFAATDQKPLLEEAKKVLGKNLIYYEVYRANQTTSPYMPQQLAPTNGEDVLIETLLLSKCDYFIHTLSQVSTAVLYFNPSLNHTLIY